MDVPDGLLAHSSPGDRPAQSYHDHVHGVRTGTSDRFLALLRHHRAALPDPSGTEAQAAPPVAIPGRSRKPAARPAGQAAVAGLADRQGSLDRAAWLHDLGKLDPENQAALRTGTAGRMPWDHVDAGVAACIRAGDWTAAFLVRAHHRPGLPNAATIWSKLRALPPLRGPRWATPREDDPLVMRTDGFLDSYLAAHAAETGLGPEEAPLPGVCHGIDLRLALSCMVDADHSDTARAVSGQEQPTPSDCRWNERIAAVDRFAAALRGGSEERSAMRRSFFEACAAASAQGPCASSSIVTCEGPVGIGKTLGLFRFMLGRARAQGLRRIIVVAPFTSIISQTVEVLRRAAVLPDEDPDEVVAEHHHKVEFGDIRTRHLAQGWVSPIVVTTAVQLFETLAGNEPARLRKLHRFPGSGVILDEAHACLPAHLLPQAFRWMQEYGSRWNCVFALASGSLARFWTLPEMVPQGHAEVPEIMPPDLLASALDLEGHRVRLHEAGTIRSLDGLREQVLATPGPRLVILNTVKTAAGLAARMIALGDDVLHLSTALAPRDRDAVLAKAKARLGKDGDNDWTLVATSIIEAGVDVSFRTAWRERFRFTSLLQTGGRVNRNAEVEDGGDVWDFMLAPSCEGATAHPDAKIPGRFVPGLIREYQAGATPSYVSSRALALEFEETTDGSGAQVGRLIQDLERKGDYPGVAERFKVVESDGVPVIVDDDLVERIRSGESIRPSEIARGSVQVRNIEGRSLPAAEITPGTGLLMWTGIYDRDVLGYMADPRASA